MTQYVFRFGGGVSDGDETVRGNKNILGGKGANLDGMASIGLPVPPGFTITTEMCTAYYANGQSFPDSVRAEVAGGLAHIEQVTGKAFGDAANPLLVSVRSGARVSMPGMMDTVLNLGLNDQTVEGLATSSGDARFAWDSYRRFIQMYADVVLELDHGAFEEALEIAKEDQGYYLDTELSADDLKALVAEYKRLVQAEWGKPFPQDVHDQLWGAVGAVFGSWESDRAKVYRRLNNIPGDWGTAVNVQAMVFGNMGETSATGVAFTRDPATGENAYYGEYLINAQGEDVVAGIRTPQYLTKAARERAGAKPLSMEEAMPAVYAELARVFDILETHYRDMQDIEFTVEREKLWMLQTRSGKRTAKAALKIAVDMADAGLITTDEAVLRVDPMALDQLLHPGMHAATGILTARGGMTSHAAVVARGMGRPCVSGAGSLQIDAAGKTLRIAGRTLHEGDIITLDGSTGEVMAGEVPTLQPELVGDFGTLMVWADAGRRMKVRANAETPLDAQTARDFGAEGIGLCRTEHMFFDAARITAVRQMILADDEKGRRVALDKLLPEQRKDFAAIFEVMAGLPVTIRLLDPPLHEFLPHQESEFAEVAAAAGVGIEVLKQRAAELHEFNPMLGHRGCRLGVTYPEIYEMQARAIFEAACSLAVAPVPEVMIPLVGTRRELELMKDVVDKAAEAVFAEQGKRIEYLVGTMIELPRAALMALGICGEHGGDPASIAFCEKVGLDYVSASPYRVPIARLAAAQAALARK
ncbi:MAG: pyruvate, phosphate dikinase [Sphingomonadaceae bacterium]|uniref:putative PEP-binding protein n=1 Tax=Sphingorhabdus sp. TaxID=1902408 RepID=UPI0039BD139B|nr:pyruvate, phosphate dikinase [Sphingomonadaceae bacterium]